MFRPNSQLRDEEGEMAEIEREAVKGEKKCVRREGLLPSLSLGETRLV